MRGLGGLAMATFISRDRIQFESFADQVNDGNEQLHRDRSASEWAIAATDYLTAHGGGEASVRIDKDHTRLAIEGDHAIAEAADEAGMAAAQKYIDDQIAALTVD